MAQIMTAERDHFVGEVTLENIYPLFYRCEL